MSARHRRYQGAAAAVLICGGLAAGGSAAAQNAAYFSPTYAASRGSPYSDVYARTFGAAPLETAAPPAIAMPAPATPATLAPSPRVTPEPPVVYVIEDGRLLTYNAEDYARGKGQAIAHADAPVGEPPYGGPLPQVRVPTIADRLYAPAPLETAAGKPAGDSKDQAPISLLPNN